ncbi:Zinc finger bed domain-containing protein daysleeper [Thalictrum thalictroides]|uniref:Zinc finger bed domain-containing protein daysleeper n=1 Tax=Thalictrum thalictroides TaxID=46969 RepID=A0A7J6WLR2_THATH|nr:Zinc finger bed domain-containing protein daysleeper [Thalictrum thalictroides]
MFVFKVANTVENNEQENSEAQPNKRRRKKSIVWEHFTVENAGAGCTRACCKRCKQTFAYSSGSKVAGTSHLKRHIALGTCPVIRRREEKNQLTPYFPPSKSGATGSATDPPKRRYRGGMYSPNFSFDPDRCRQEVAEMIIMHEYQLHMVEHPAFISFVKNLQPRFDLVNFNTVQGDCVAIYLREKQDLVKLLGGLPGRINLTLDMWSSNQTLGYVTLTGHFIDVDWKLNRRILNVVMVPSPHSGDALSHAVGICLGDWGLENKLFTLTLDKGITTDSEPGSLRGYLSVKNTNVLDGQLLIEHCYAQVLTSLAQDALGAMAEIVNKVRESVKYVKTSQVQEEKFLELKQQLQVPSMKSLSFDDQTQWNTTYLMLVAAMELKEVFSCLDTADPDYSLAPSMNEWKQVETLCTILKLLYDAASILTGPTCPTANLYFHEVWKLQLEITLAAMSEDAFISDLTKPLKEKFDQYWNDCKLVLAMAVVMDPRFKMKLVEFSFGKLYGEEASIFTNIIDESIHELFSEYIVQPHILQPQMGETQMEQPLLLTSGYMELDNADNEISNETAVDAANITANDIANGISNDTANGAGTDAGNEAGTETGIEAGTETAIDAGHEVAIDAGHEVATDAGHEAVNDTVTEVANDTGSEAVNESANGTANEGVIGTSNEAASEGVIGIANETINEEVIGMVNETVNEEVLGTSNEAAIETVDEMVIDKIELPHISPKGGPPLLPGGDRLLDFDVFISELSGTQQTKSELDQYLEESLLPRTMEFDILGWWKLNNLKYPTLSKLARDILSISLSTVGPESVFNTAGNKLDTYRSSLRPETVEALICAKDWLQYAAKEPSNAPLKLEY